MNKLFKLKEWLPLEEAALYISEAVSEPVTIADFYRFALEGTLKISVYFVNNAYATKGKWLKTDDIANLRMNSNLEAKQNSVNYQTPVNPNEMFVSKDDWVLWENGVHEIEGVWDLTMRGKEALELKKHYELHNTTASDKYILLQQDNVVCRPYELFDRDEIFNPNFNKSEKRRREIKDDPLNILDNCPAVILPQLRANNLGIEFIPCNKLIEKDVVLVIRTNEIVRFIESLEGGESQKKQSLLSNERNSLLVLIAALCQKANVDWDRRGIATSLVVMIDSIGASLGDDTLRKILKQISPALLSTNIRQEEKFLSATERNSLLVLIAALCKEVNVDWNKRGITPSLVVMTNQVGAPLSDDTICNILMQIDNAVLSRSK